MQGVLSEVDVILPFSNAVEGSERFLAGLCRIRVYGGNGAAGTGLGKSEINSSNADFSPAIFCIGGATGNNQIGSEASHREIQLHFPV